MPLQANVLVMFLTRRHRPVVKILCDRTKEDMPFREISAQRMIDVLNPTQLVMDAFVDQLEVSYRKIYSNLEPSYPGIISFMGRLALENFANNDAPYHDVNHTILVTQVGQEIIFF